MHDMNNEKAHNEPNTSPFGRKLLKDLREAGKKGLNPARLKIAGAKKELQRLCKLGYAVPLGNSMYLSLEAYDNHVRAILDNRKPGDTVSIGDARESTGLSRKYLIPILNLMETDEYLKRTGDLREVLRTPAIDSSG